jgi:hypothetical protein
VRAPPSLKRYGKRYERKVWTVSQPLRGRWDLYLFRSLRSGSSYGASIRLLVDSLIEAPQARPIVNFLLRANIWG